LIGGGALATWEGQKHPKTQGNGGFSMKESYQHPPTGGGALATGEG